MKREPFLAILRGENLMRKKTASAAQNRRISVPLFNQFRDNLRKDFVLGKTVVWIPFETSLLLRDDFATISLQSRGVFVSLLLLCGLLGSDEISANTRYLANALNCDARTLENCLIELAENSLIFEIENLDIEKKLEEAALNSAGGNPSPKKSKTPKKVKATDSDQKPKKPCERCNDSREMIKHGRIVSCPYCVNPATR